MRNVVGDDVPTKINSEIIRFRGTYPTGLSANSCSISGRAADKKELQQLRARAELKVRKCVRESS